MNKTDLIDSVADRLGGTKAEATKAVEAVLGSIGDGVATTGDVRIAGFGGFAKANRAARSGRNPATGAEIMIPAKVGVKFKPAKELVGRL